MQLVVVNKSSEDLLGIVADDSGMEQQIHTPNIAPDLIAGHQWRLLFSAPRPNGAGEHFSLRPLRVPWTAEESDICIFNKIRFLIFKGLESKLAVS